MKKTIVIIILACLFLTSCSQIKDTANSDNKTDLNVGVDSISDKGDEILNNNEVISNIDSQLDYETNNQGDDVGGTGGCMVHGDGYHTFPGRLTEYVGEDRFDEWFEEVGKDYVYSTTDCPCKSSNIYEFIRYFNVPKEATINAYNENTRYYYLCTLDIDLLYDGTAEENDQFYRETFSDYAERYRKINFFSMKGALLQRNKKMLDSYLNETVDFDNISMIEIIYAANITREQMEANIEEANSMMPNDGLKIAYDYDLDLIYEQREYVESLIKEHSAFYLDLLFCGLEPRELPYE